MMPPAPPDDDDVELELEPIDPEILAAEKARAQRKTDEALTSVDVDEIVRETLPDGEFDVDWNWLTRFRFTTRHLLTLTAILAIVLTLKNQLGGCNSIVATTVIALAAGWYWILRQERRLAAERARRREQLVAAGYGGAKPAGDAPVDEVAVALRREFKFAFSLQQLLGATTVAAVMFALMSFLGSDNLSVVLGLIALAGLVVHLAGFEAAPIVVLGWWMLLVLYLITGIFAAVSAHAVLSPQPPTAWEVADA